MPYEPPNMAFYEVLQRDLECSDENMRSVCFGRTRQELADAYEEAEKASALETFGQPDEAEFLETEYCRAQDTARKLVEGWDEVRDYDSGLVTFVNYHTTDSLPKWLTVAVGD